MSDQNESTAGSTMVAYRGKMAKGGGVRRITPFRRSFGFAPSALRQSRRRVAVQATRKHAGALEYIRYRTGELA